MKKFSMWAVVILALSLFAAPGCKTSGATPYFSTLGGVHTVATAPAAVVASLPFETPVWANDFVDSIGLNTHCSFVSQGWADCKNPIGSQNAITTLGVRHIRDGLQQYWNGSGPFFYQIPYNGVSQSIANYYNDLASQGNVSYDWVISQGEGYHSNYVSAFQAAVPSTESFELAGNEVDGFSGSPTVANDVCPSPNPNGLSCWVTDVQTQLNGSYPASIAAAGLKRYGPSIEYGSAYTCSTNTSNPPYVRLSSSQCLTPGTANLSLPGNFSSVLDYGNMHAYLGGNNPGNVGLAQYIAAEVPFVGSKPLVITEDGYGTNQNGLTDAIISKFEPRLFAENWYEGVKLTHQFELLDQTTGAAGSYFYTFGLLTSSGSPNWIFTPKIQYESLRSLIHIMNDPGTRPTLVPVSYRMTGFSSAVHHILTQRQDGTYQLMMWVEGPNGSTSSQTGTIQFYFPQFNSVSVSTFTPNNGQYSVGSVNPTLVNGYMTMPITVSDTMSIYQFGTRGFSPATPQPAATPFVMATATPTATPLPPPAYSNATPGANGSYPILVTLPTTAPYMTFMATVKGQTGLATSATSGGPIFTVPNALSLQGGLFDNGTNPSTAKGLHLYLNGSGAQVSPTNGLLPDPSVYTIVGTVDASGNANIYTCPFGGAQCSLTTYPSSAITFNGMTAIIGGSPDGQRIFAGDLWNFQVWPFALTANQVQTQANAAPPDPYPSPTATPTIAPTATPVPSPTPIYTMAAPGRTYPLAFSVPATAPQMTIVAQIKCTAQPGNGTSGGQTAVSLTTTFSLKVGLCDGGTNPVDASRLSFYNYASNQQPQPTVGLTPGTIYTLIGVQDAANAYLYVCQYPLGACQQSTVASSVLAPTGSSGFIGSDDGSGTRVCGPGCDIWNVQVFTAAIQPNQAQGIANAGVADPYPSPTPGPISANPTTLAFAGTSAGSQVVTMTDPGYANAYTVTSSPTGIVTTSVNGSAITVYPSATGQTTLTITGYNGTHATVTVNIGSPFGYACEGANAYPLKSPCFTGKTPFHDTIAQLENAGATVTSDGANNGSAAYNAWATSGFNPSYNGGGAPLYIAQSTDPQYSVTCNYYGGGPCNAATSVTGKKVHIPAGAVQDSGSDHHISIFDPANNLDIDMWGGGCGGAASCNDHSGNNVPQACQVGTATSGVLTCSWGGSYTFSGDGRAYYNGGTEFSGNAAGYPIAMFDIVAQELLQGHIDHGLGYEQPCVDGNAVYPSAVGRGSDASCSNEPNIRYGQIIHLKSSVNYATKYNSTKYCQVIQKAMQTYGMYLVDTNPGGGISVLTENINIAPDSTPWSNTIKPSLGSGGDKACLTVIPSSDIEIIQLNQAGDSALP